MAGSDIDALRGFNPGGSGGGGLFLKLADGDQVKVRLASLPVIFQNAFEDQRTGEVKIDTRFAFVVWNHDESKAQIWITNGATYGQQIAPLLDDDEYGDWREYDVKLSRSGEKAQTRYYVRPGTKRESLTADQGEAVENVDIIEKISKGKGASQVMWLTEYKKLQEAAKNKDNKDNADDADPAVPDKVINDIGDDPINLDDIPF